MCEHKPLRVCVENGDLVGQTEGFPTDGVKMWIFGIYWKDTQGDTIKADEAVNKGPQFRFNTFPDIAETAYMCCLSLLVPVIKN